MNDEAKQGIREYLHLWLEQALKGAEFRADLQRDPVAVGFDANGSPVYGAGQDVVLTLRWRESK